MKFSSILASAALLAMTLSAQAGISATTANGLISIDDLGAIQTVPGNNNFVTGSYDVGGNIFANYDISLTFTYLQHEAGYNNDFNALGTINLNNKGNTIGDSATGAANAGLVNFNFYSNNVSAGVSNGSNFPFGSAQSFATMLDYTWAPTGVVYDFVLFFDDSGANVDDNHDDHIIGAVAERLSVVEASEPGALALLGLGLLAMRIATRRKV
jgi:MYXO-CTERM domain-containing protein